MSAPVTVAYSPEYLDWQLGDGHPTNPERAGIAVDLITAWADEEGVPVAHRTPAVDVDRARAAAEQVHASEYVDHVLSGRSSEWSGEQPRLGEVASLMFTATLDLVDDVLADRERGVRGVYFNPQGAKHHARYDRGSGFCVLNDMAAAAVRLNAAGLRVLYVDWDAHHGDGVEALLRGNTDAVTASIHDGSIYPGSGRDGHDPANGVYNWALKPGAGDSELLTAFADLLQVADAVAPDVVLLACGADVLAGDPLSNLQFSLDGIRGVAAALGAWAADNDAPVLVGGAGGYLPLTETPRAWSETIRALAMSGPTDVSGVRRTLISSG